MVWVLAAVVAAACAALGAAYYFSERVLRIRTRTNDEVLALELDAGTIARQRLESLAKEEFSLPSPFGYKLHAWFIPSDAGETRRAVVLAHGVTSSLYGMLKYADLFLRRGFNVLLYDHRRHGRSEGSYTSYGYYEKRDLAAAVDWVYGRLGPDAVVGVFGESMGAATVLQYAAEDGRAAFVGADCPYSDLTEQLALRLKAEYGLPKAPLLPLTSLWCKLRAGFFFRDVSPIRNAERIRSPLLLVHGREDKYVPYAMSEALYERTTAPKRLYLAPNAAHAESLRRNREEYERVVDAFLREHGFLNEESEEEQRAAPGHAPA